MGFFSGLEKGYKEFSRQFEAASESAGGCVGWLLPWSVVVAVLLALILSVYLTCGSGSSLQTPDFLLNETHEPRPEASVVDAMPWVTNARELSSFPADVPPPTFVGAFAGDAGAGVKTYELHLWTDRKGVFGELLSPVLEVDSPASRLYEPFYDGRTGELKFSAKFGSTTLYFIGALTGGTITGVATRDGKHEERLSLQRTNQGHGAGASSYTSRAQFERAMDLYHRY